MSPEISKEDAARVAIMQAQQAIADNTAILIASELRPELPKLEAMESGAAAKVAECIEALKLPLANIAALDADISACQRELADLALQADDSRPLKMRTDASLRIAVFENELEKLAMKREQQLEFLRPYEDAKDAASQEMKRVQGLIMYLHWSIANPLSSASMGAGTMAYQFYRRRSGHMLDIILLDARDSPEWDSACSVIRECHEIISGKAVPGSARQAADSVAQALRRFRGLS